MLGWVDLIGWDRLCFFSFRLVVVVVRLSLFVVVAVAVGGRCSD